MLDFSRARLFQKTATALLIIFMGLMGLVVIAAYSRHSGSTRQDMATAHLVRQEKLPVLERSD
jgi:lipopolysaccharide export LptBFGC system permease protein LptF